MNDEKNKKRWASESNSKRYLGRRHVSFLNVRYILQTFNFLQLCAYVKILCKLSQHWFVLIQGVVFFPLMLVCASFISLCFTAQFPPSRPVPGSLSLYSLSWPLLSGAQVLGLRSSIGPWVIYSPLGGVFYCRLVALCALSDRSTVP